MEIIKTQGKKISASFHSLLAFGLLGACVVHNATAATQVYGFTGNAANAWISTSDSCGYSYGSVSGADNTVQSQPGAPTATSSGSVYASSYNWCTGDYSSIWGWSDNVNFNINASLNKASMSSVISGMEYNNTTCASGCATDFTVNANWVGVGDMSSQSYNNQYSYGNVRYISNTRGNFRDADTSLTINGGTWQMNNAGTGFMGVVRSHSVSVTHP